jgi:hypothetical protein
MCSPVAAKGAGRVATDDDCEMGVWSLSAAGHAGSSTYLQKALEDGRLAHSLVCIVVDVSKPALVVAELERWLAQLEAAVQVLAAADPVGFVALKQANEQALLASEHWPCGDVLPSQPELDAQLKSAAQMAESLRNPAAQSTTLRTGLLVKNLGIPIVVAAHRADGLERLQKSHTQLRGTAFDVLQGAIRLACLPWGAALVYTSNAGGGLGVLREYVLHRLFRVPCQAHARTLELQSVFVPAGWDYLQRVTAFSGELSANSVQHAFSVVSASLPSASEVSDSCLDWTVHAVHSLLHARAQTAAPVEKQWEDEETFLATLTDGSAPGLSSPGSGGAANSLAASWGPSGAPKKEMSATTKSTLATLLAARPSASASSGAGVSAGSSSGSPLAASPMKGTRPRS